MKSLITLIIVLFIGFSGCEKPIKAPKVIQDGTYYGTFQRNPISGEGEKANISITFASGKWIGESDMQNYPALCHGTYRMEGNKLIFTNDCAFTAEFDWSLILNGEYDINLIDDTLLISKKYGNPSIEEFTDLYRVSLPRSGVKLSPINGTWVETTLRTDTMVFIPEYDGLFPIFMLNRGLQNDSLRLPKHFSGPYWYRTGDKSISINWFLSSNSAYHRYYYKLLPSGNEFIIENFFEDQPSPSGRDTLVFTRIF